MQPAQIDVGRNGAGAEDFQDVVGAGFDQRQIADEVERMVCPGGDVASEGVLLFGAGHLVHDETPLALGGVGIGGAEIGQRDLLIQDGLPERFVLRVEQRFGGGFVAGSQALLFAVVVVLSVVDAVAAVEAELWFHNIAFCRQCYFLRRPFVIEQAVSWQWVTTG